MENILDKIAQCVEFGKINLASPYPPDMKGQDGADELTRQALEQGVPPEDILNKAFVLGMDRIGRKFSENKVFVPQMLMSAKAMSTGMQHLKPYFSTGEVKRKGKFIIGTVAGDLHDIGKNLVAMMVEGSGWEVIDLGVDVKSGKFIEHIKSSNARVVALSALLTTTMANMEKIVKDIREQAPNVKICVGGAPVTQDFCNKIEADYYSPDPQGLVEYLTKLVA
jgi:corrinoid protein of di/trimethylamine methyltransferase